MIPLPLHNLRLQRKRVAVPAPPAAFVALKDTLRVGRISPQPRHLRVFARHPLWRRFFLRHRETRVLWADLIELSFRNHAPFRPVHQA